MNTILVPIDFSERSDRAIRRSLLLAKQTGAALLLVHVVDDDQPDPLIAAASDAAEALLADQVRTLRQTDGVRCKSRVVTGDPFDAIARTANAISADLVVIGPHRRAILGDIFTGTTAERSIRASRIPVLMANGLPSAGYRRALIALDISAASAAAVKALATLGLCADHSTSALYVFDAPGAGLISGASMSADRARAYMLSEEARARAELDGFLSRLPTVASELIVKAGATSPARVILETMREIDADLVVLGTRGRTGAGRLLLGSVAAEVLRAADRDVLAVPSRPPA